MPNLNDLIFPQFGITSDLIAGTGLDQDDLGITADSLGIDLSGGSPEEILYKEVTDGSRKPYMIPTITSVNNRQNSPSNTWTNQDSWTNFYTYLNSDSDAERAFWHTLGTFRQDTTSYQNYDLANFSSVQYAKGYTVGGDGQHNTHPRNTSYGPFRGRVMFIRNHHPNSAKSVNVYSFFSSYWSSGYDGAGFSVGAPNQLGTYTGVTSINWTRLWDYTGSDNYRTNNASFTIQPQSTVAVILNNTMYYWTSGDDTYRWYDTNGFYNLDNTFSDNWIQPDLKLTYAASKFNALSQDYNSYSSHKVWNFAGELFGDR